MVITRRSPVLAVLYLILNFFSLAGLYLTLQAQFIAVIQILVYAGAIMVLFLFVIMLLNLRDEERLTEKISVRKMIGVGLSAAVLLQVLYVLGFSGSDLPVRDVARAEELGSVESIGKALFTDFLFPFEVTSIVLIVAIVGAVILAKKKLD
ncbi:MAG: NADH-quinone oxidoreductase subunit J [Ignavibacteriales bacterium]|nr:NADH-quinone oxidoreductase subunit J [Ignavibacteriales bacterium]